MSVKAHGWIALQTAVAAISVIVTIVVSTAAYRDTSPDRIDNIDARVSRLNNQQSVLQSQIVDLDRRWNENGLPPWWNPGRK